MCVREERARVQDARAERGEDTEDIVLRANAHGPQRQGYHIEPYGYAILEFFFRVSLLERVTSLRLRIVPNDKQVRGMVVF